jgi:hypothetical protein
VGAHPDDHVDRKPWWGVLLGVGEQVADHLLEPGRVAHRHRRVLGQPELDRPVAAAGEVTGGPADDLADVGVLEPDVELAVLHPRDAEQVVDQPLELPGLLQHHRQQAVPLGLVGQEVRAEQQGEVALDRRQRCPQLVGHGGDEVLLGLLDLALRGDVAGHDHGELAGAIGIRYGRDGERHLTGPAV